MFKYHVSLTLVIVLFCSFGTANAAQPAVGELAPDFRLQDQDNKWHTRDSFRGNWVALYFYPKADTPGCTTESCAFRDDIFKFKKMGVKVVGISLDDVESQKEFSDKYHLPFPLLSDAKQETAKAYGVFKNRGVMKYAKRETFIIDPEGKIAKHYAKVDPDKHSAQVLTDVQKLASMGSKEEVTDL